MIKKILARWHSVAAFSAPFVWVFDHEPTHCESLKNNDLNAAHYIAFLQLTGTLIVLNIVLQSKQPYVLCRSGAPGMYVI